MVANMFYMLNGLLSKQLILSRSLIWMEVSSICRRLI